MYEDDEQMPNGIQKKCAMEKTRHSRSQSTNYLALQHDLQLIEMLKCAAHIWVCVCKWMCVWNVVSRVVTRSLIH